MKMKGYADRIVPLMLEHNIITKEDEEQLTRYLNTTFGGEEYA